MNLTIKIGRRTYDIKEGDYLLYNGSSVLFCSGDDRVLKQEGFDSYRHLSVPASVQSKFKEEVKGLKKQYNNKKGCYLYYFKKP